MAFSYKDFPRESTAFLGPPGLLIPIPFTNNRDAETDFETRWAYKTTVTGRKHAQRVGKSNRIWPLTLESMPEAVYAALTALNMSLVDTEPLSFITPEMAAQNLLTPADSRMENELYSTNQLMFTPAGAVLMPDGTFVPGSLITSSTTGLQTELTSMIPVMADLTIAASAWVKADPAYPCTLVFSWYDSTGRLLSTDSTGSWASSEPTWTRVSWTSVAPDGACYCTVGTQYSSGIAGIQVCWGDSINGEPAGWDKTLTTYIPGMGVKGVTFEITSTKNGVYNADGYWTAPELTITELG